MHSLTADIVLRSLGQVGSTVLAILAGVIVLEAGIYLIFGKLLKHRHTLPIMLLAPAAIGLLALIVYPILYEIVLSFSNMSLFTFRNPKFGFIYAERNFGDVFTEPVLKQVHFLPVFLRTVLWTTIQVTFHVTLGLGLALLLNRPHEASGPLPHAAHRSLGHSAGRRVLAWRGEFHFEYGFVNIVLRDIGLHGIEWKSEPLLELRRHEHHQHLARRPLHDGDPARGPAEHRSNLLRGGRDGRRGSVRGAFAM